MSSRPVVWRVLRVALLAGQATRHEACDVGIVCVEVDRMRVKGKCRDVTLFTPLPAALAGIPTFHDEMRLCQLALASHRLQHWSEAQARLQQLKFWLRRFTPGRRLPAA